MIGQTGIEILRAMRDFENRNGYMPTYQQIADDVKAKSTGHIYWWMLKLKKQGYVEKAPGHCALTDAGYDFIADMESKFGKNADNGDRKLVEKIVSFLQPEALDDCEENADYYPIARKIIQTVRKASRR